MNYFAGDVLNGSYGPLLQQLIMGKSTALQSKFDSLPTIPRGPLYEGSYPTPDSELFEGSYPTYREPLEGSYPNDVQDLLYRPKTNRSTFSVPPGTSDDDIDQFILRRFF